MHHVQSSLWSKGLEAKGLAQCTEAVCSDVLWKTTQICSCVHFGIMMLVGQEIDCVYPCTCYNFGQGLINFFHSVLNLVHSLHLIKAL